MKFTFLQHRQRVSCCATRLKRTLTELSGVPGIVEASLVSRGGDGVAFMSYAAAEGRETERERERRETLQQQALIADRIGNRIGEFYVNCTMQHASYA